MWVGYGFGFGWVGDEVDDIVVGWCLVWGGDVVGV